MSYKDFSGAFLFRPPSRLKTVSDLTYTAMQMSALSGRLALEDRTLVNNKGGRAENVAEHSCMIAIVAPVVAEAYFPDLDANLVARFAALHDAVEAYVGDTPTHDIDTTELAKKAMREQAGLQQLRHDYRAVPGFVKIITKYEEQEVPEARFVRVIDKLMPLLVHFCEGGETLRGSITVPELLKNSARKAEQLRQEYPEFEILIKAREELAELAGKHLY